MSDVIFSLFDVFVVAACVSVPEPREMQCDMIYMHLKADWIFLVQHVYSCNQKNVIFSRKKT